MQDCKKKRKFCKKAGLSVEPTRKDALKRGFECVRFTHVR